MGTNVNEEIKLLSITYLVNYYSLFNFTLIEVFPFSNYMFPSSFIPEAEPHVSRTEEPLVQFKVDPKEELGGPYPVGKTIEVKIAKLCLESEASE